MQRRLAGLTLCLLAVLVYSNSFRTGFVLDSRVLVLDDPRLRAATLDNLELIFQRSYWWPYTEGNLYRPVTTLSYLVNYSILGGADSPIGYHVVNLLLHVANVLLLFAIAQRLSTPGFRQATGFFVAALWAVHPLSTEAVTNIVGRADLLAATGTLGALFAHLRAGETAGTERRGWRVATLAAATLAMFSKESGVAVIGVIILYDLIVRRVPAWRTWLVLLAPLAVLLYQRSVVTPAVLPPEPFVDNPIAGAPFWTGRLTALAVMGRYIWLIVWPRTLSSDYSFNQIPLATGSPLDWAAWITALAAVAATILLLVRGHRLAVFAAAFAFVTFLPASNLLFPTGTIMAERLMYLSLAGAIACVVMGVLTALRLVEERGRLWPNGSRTTAVAGSVLIMLITAAFALRAWDRNRDWSDDVTLWASAVEAAPDSFKAHKGLADALYESDPQHRELDRVLRHADRAIAILDPLPNERNVPAAYRRTAGYHVEQGDRLTDAGGNAAAIRQAYERAVSLTERYLAIVRSAPLSAGPTAATSDAEVVEAYKMLSSANLRLQDTARALAAAQRAQEMRPFDSAAYRLTSAALITSKQFDEAAVTLLTGFMVTGDAELRQATMDLYRSDAHPTNCALKQGREGMVLDPSCDRVHRHLCAASERAAAIQRRSGRTDLAEQLDQVALQGYGCGQ